MIRVKSLSVWAVADIWCACVSKRTAGAGAVVFVAAGALAGVATGIRGARFGIVGGVTNCDRFATRCPLSGAA
jgi:hypothetical protein